MERPSIPDVETEFVIIGAGVAVQSNKRFVVVGDQLEPLDSKGIYLARVDINFRFASPPWPKTYGTSTSTYSSSAVTTLQDGSIVLVGTADLEGIEKIIVIKTGPNGEMTF